MEFKGYRCGHCNILVPLALFSSKKIAFQVFLRHADRRH